MLFLLKSVNDRPFFSRTVQIIRSPIFRITGVGLILCLSACTSTVKNKIQTLEATPPPTPKSTNDWRAHAELKYRNGDTTGALQDLLTASKTITDDHVLFYSLGLCYQRLEKYQEAEQYFTKSIALHPTATSHMERARTYSSLGNYGNSAIDLDRALELCNQHPSIELYKLMAFVSLQRGKSQEAIQSASQVILEDPGYINAYLIRGEALYRNGKFSESIKDYDNAIRLNPPSKEKIYFNRSLAHLKIRDLDSAALDLKMSLEQNPNESKYYNLLGYILFNQGKLEKALTYLNKACEIEPTATNLSSRGYCYVRMGNARSAFADIDKAIELSKNSTTEQTHDGERYRVRGRIKFELNDRAGAMTDFTKAIELGETDSDMYDIMGEIMKLAKQWDQAIQFYNRAILLNPLNARYYDNEGVSYASTGQTQIAGLCFNKAISINPKLASAYNNRGYLSLIQGKVDKAIEDFDHCIELDDSFGNAYINRGNAKIRKGDDIGGSLDLARGSTRPSSGSP